MLLAVKRDNTNHDSCTSELLWTTDKPKKMKRLTSQPALILTKTL